MPVIRRPRGVVPKEQGCSLPSEFASEAINLNLSSGQWEGWRSPVECVTFPFPVKRVHLRDCCWAGVDDVKARYVDAGVDKKTYLSGAGRPAVTDSLCDQHWCFLGYPVPDPAVPVVDRCMDVPYGPDTQQVRYRIAYGTECEVGAASCPSEVVLSVKDTTIALAMPEPPDALWCATHIHIYRQVATWNVEQGLLGFQDNEINPGFGALDTDSDWFHVKTLPIETRAWVDAGEDIGQLLTTDDYFPPDEDLILVGDTASGSLVGYQKDEVWFSEKNTYYAFPLKARHKFESRVVDVCVDRDLVVVFTCEGIWTLNDSVDCRDAGCRQGQQMSMSYPLIGPRACTVTPSGIVYASIEGLHLIQEGGERLVSRAAFDRNSWLSQGLDCLEIHYARDHLWVRTAKGTMVWQFAFDESRQLPPDVSYLSFAPEQWLSSEEGDLYLLSNGKALQFDVGEDYLHWTWRQTDQRTDQSTRLSGLYAEYVKKNSARQNNVTLFIDGKPVVSKALREGTTRIRGQRSRCHQLQIKGKEPMCSAGYGAGLARGE